MNEIYKCPKCGKECVFKWQRFKDGTLHIRQECHDHGYVKYVHRAEPYITLAGTLPDEMQTINVEFTNEEYTMLLDVKKCSGLNWHDFIIEAAEDWVAHDRYKTKISNW